MKKKILKTLLVTAMVTLLMGCNKEVDKNINKNIQGDSVNIDILGVGSIDFSKQEEEEEDEAEVKSIDDLYRIDGAILKENGQTEFIFGFQENYEYRYREVEDTFELRLGYKNTCSLLYEGEEADKNKEAFLDLIRETDEYSIVDLREFLYIYIDDKDLECKDEEYDLCRTEHLEFYDRNGDRLDLIKDKQKIIDYAKEYKKVYEEYVDEEQVENCKGIPYAHELDGICLGDFWDLHDYETFREHGYKVMYEFDSYEIAGDADVYILYKGDLCEQYTLYRVHVEPDGYTIMDGKFTWDMYMTE